MPFSPHLLLSLFTASTSILFCFLRDITCPVPGIFTFRPEKHQSTDIPSCQPPLSFFLSKTLSLFPITIPVSFFHAWKEKGLDLYCPPHFLSSFIVFMGSLLLVLLKDKMKHFPMKAGTELTFTWGSQAYTFFFVLCVQFLYTCFDKQNNRVGFTEEGFSGGIYRATECDSCIRLEKRFPDG